MNKANLTVSYQTFLRAREEMGRHWEKEILAEIESGCNFYFIGDNIDGTIHPREVDLNIRDHQFHWFTLSLVSFRVDDPSLSSDLPQMPIADLPESAFFQSPSEISMEKESIKHMIAKTLCDYLPNFKHAFKAVIPERLMHSKTAEMDQKSNIFPLPIIFKDEKENSQCVEILEEIRVLKKK